ncbi:MAG: DUF2007 domain-containing protein [Bacteroidetes bacterium]|nr:DUF2007 domain-containing protein [Bacteroidota bacterium]
MEEGWKEVFITAIEYKSEMAKDILENQGINTVVLNQHDSAYQNFGEFSLYVAQENATRAIELLKELKN